MITLCTPKIVIKKIFFFFAKYKSRKNVNVGDKATFIKTESNQDRWHDVKKILVSKEESYGTKSTFRYFFGYNDNDIIRPLSIKLPQMTGFVRKFEGNTTMPYKISKKQLLTKYNQTWRRVKKLLKIKHTTTYFLKAY